MPTRRLVALLLPLLAACAPTPTPSESTGFASQALTPAFVQQAYQTPHGSGITSVSVHLTANVGAGHTLIVAVGSNATSSVIASVTDTLGDTFHVGAPWTTSGGLLGQAIYYAIGTPSGSDTVTVTYSPGATDPDIRVAEYTNVAAFDVSGSHGGTSTTNTVGPVTTTAAGDLIVAANMTNGSTFSAGTGYTSRVITTPDSDILEDRIAGAAGAYSATANTSNDVYILQMAAFTPVVVVDAGTDAGQDAGTDTGVDTGADTGTDAPADTGADTALDAQDSAAEAGMDATVDTGVDSGLDATPDAPPDAAPDAPACLAPELVQHVSGSSTRNNTMASPWCYHLQLPGPATAGNAIVVGYTAGTAATPSVTDDAGDAYAMAASVFDSTHGHAVGVLTALNVTAGARVLNLCFSSSPGTFVEPMASEFANVVGIDTATTAIGTGTEVNAGTLAPSASGDLVYQVAMSASAKQASYAPGSEACGGYALLSADLLDGFAAQYGVLPCPLVTTPTLWQGTSDAWVTASVALLAGTTGGTPSGLRIVHLTHENIPFHVSSGGTGSPFANPDSIQFPCSGNLLAGMIGGGNATETVTGITDNGANAWHQAGTTQVIAGNDTTQAWYAGNAQCRDDLRLSLSWSGTSGDFTAMLYDVVGAANAPLDVTAGATGSQSTAGPLTMPYTLTPTTGSTLVLSEVIWDFNTGGGLSGQLFDTNTFSGESQSGPEPVDENNGWGHLVTTSTAPVSFTWQPIFSGLAVGNWAATSVAFRGQ